MSSVTALCDSEQIQISLTSDSINSMRDRALYLPETDVNIYTRSLQTLSQGKQTVGKKDIYHDLIGELLVSWNCPAPESKTIARFQVQIPGGLPSRARKEQRLC